MFVRASRERSCETFRAKLSRYNIWQLVFAVQMRISSLHRGLAVSSCLALAVGLLAACGNSTATSDWNSGSAVLSDLEAAGIACPWQGTGDQVATAAGATSEAFIVQCGDYSVTVVDSVAEEIDVAQETASCQDLSASVAQSPQAQTLLVTGDNYLAQPLGTEWPATPAPQDIAKAFDGEVVAAIDLYGQVCPNAVILDGADDSDSWRKTMRRVAMTGGAVAVYLNRDVSDAETDGQGEATSDETQREVDGDKSDDQSSDLEETPEAPEPSESADIDSRGWLQERLDGIREWLSSLGQSVDSSPSGT